MKFLGIITFICFVFRFGWHHFESLFQSNIELLGESILLFSNILPTLIPTPIIDGDTYIHTIDLIKIRGYKFQEYKFITKDNYILTAWRVSKTISQKYPVIIQHGLLDSSFSFVANYEKQSLAFILADKGYDVWITNNRGNKYSKEHLQFNLNDDQFWDFTIDDFAKYDFPTNIENIKEITGTEKVIYIGHSQGTTQAFAHFTENIEFQNNFKVFIGLGPAVYVNHQESILISTISKLKIIDILRYLNVKTVMFSENEFAEYPGLMCGYSPFLCKFFIDLICGRTETTNLNTTRLSVMSGHTPGGASIMTLLHWMQNLRDGKFRKYDWGEKKNLEKYNNIHAPEYPVENLKNLNIPKYLFRGSRDSVVNEKDFNKLLKLLPQENTYSYIVDDYSHLDYVWGFNGYEKLYKDIVEILEKETN